MESSKQKNSVAATVQRLADQYATTHPEKALLYLKKLTKIEPGIPENYEQLAAFQKKLQYYNQAAATAEKGLQVLETKKNVDSKMKASLLCMKVLCKALSNPTDPNASRELKDLCDDLAKLVGSNDNMTKTIRDIMKGLPQTITPKQEKSTEEKREEASTVAQLFQNNRIPDREGEPVYLLSTEWFAKWKQYVGYSQVNGQEEDHRDFMDEEQHPVSFLGPIDQSAIIEDVDVLVDPDSKEDYTNYPIKLGLTENKDFLMLDQKLWKYFNQLYGGVSIPRFTYFKSERDFTPSVEIWLQRINLVFFPLPLKTQNKNIDNYEVLYISRKKTIKDLMDKIHRIYQEYYPLEDSRGRANPERLWKIDPQCDFRVYVHQLDLSRPNGLPGKILNEDTLIEDAEISDEDVILFEIQCYSVWFFEQEDRTSKKNSGQSSPTKLNPHAKELIRKFDISVDRQFKSSSRKGLTGLQNLGNTCFMNSALQCMSNTYDLTEYFLDNSFVNDLNPKNPLGTGGWLAVAYGELLKDMWFGTSSSVSPWDFKKVIGRFASQFHGYGQQDSQELLSYLLDGLHEDLNRVKDKPSVETIESNDRPDEIVAKESWLNHLKRNSSKIQELMHGQYKSRLDCPDCKRISITFDPFMMLSLPIPTVEYAKFFLYFIFDDPKVTPTKITLNLPNSTSYAEILERIGAITKAEPRNIVIGLLKDHKLTEIATEDTDASYLKEHAGIPFAYEIPELSKDRMADKKLLVHTYVSADPKGFLESEKVVSFTRLLYLDNTNTLNDVHLKVYDKMRRHINLLYERSERKSPINLEERSIDRLIREYKEVFSDHNDSNWPYRLYYNRLEGKSTKKLGKSKMLPGDNSNFFEFITKEKIDLENLVLEIKITKPTKLEFLGLNACKELEATSQSEGMSKEYTLQDCLNLFTKKEKLDKDNAWYCNKCKEHKQATKKMEIWKTPDILIIHLKRFKTSRVSSIGSFYYSTGSKKVTATIDFPIKGLDLSNYVLSKENGGCIYDLYGVVNHYGGLGGGHYTAYGKNHFDEKWYDFNDSSVSSASGREIVSSAAYVLFYKRRKN